MGKHTRKHSLRSHRKPSATRRAAASTATAALGTAAAGAIIVSGHHGVQPPVQLPAAAPVANVAAKIPLLPVKTTATAALVTVRNGDTLSGIARQDCNTEADWTGIYEKNKQTIGSDYNLIKEGQKLNLDCRVADVPVVTTVSYDHPVHYRYHHHLYVRPAVSGGYSVTSGFQSCVIRAESGGNPGIWNASGHYGLYQFSSSTWAAHGGNPADFGHASAGEQTQVFWNTVREDGTSDWAPYDGC